MTINNAKTINIDFNNYTAVQGVAVFSHNSDEFLFEPTAKGKARLMREGSIGTSTDHCVRHVYGDGTVHIAPVTHCSHIETLELPCGMLYYDSAVNSMDVHIQLPLDRCSDPEKLAQAILANAQEAADEIRTYSALIYDTDNGEKKTVKFKQA